MTTEGWNPRARGDSHRDCLVCGWKDPLSLGLVFHAEGDVVEASFRANPGLQGYRGIMHGGVTSALLDAIMTQCLFHNGITALTADLSVRFLKPIPCDSELMLSGRLVGTRPPLFVTTAELMLGDTLMASARARFLQVPLTRFD